MMLRIVVLRRYLNSTSQLLTQLLSTTLMYAHSLDDGNEAAPQAQQTTPVILDV